MRLERCGGSSRLMRGAIRCPSQVRKPASAPHRPSTSRRDHTNAGNGQPASGSRGPANVFAVLLVDRHSPSPGDVLTPPVHQPVVESDPGQIDAVTIQIGHRHAHTEGPGIVQHDKSTNAQDAVASQHVGQGVIEAVIPVDEGEVEALALFLQIWNRMDRVVLDHLDVSVEPQALKHGAARIVPLGRLKRVDDHVGPILLKVGELRLGDVSATHAVCHPHFQDSSGLEHHHQGKQKPAVSRNHGPDRGWALRDAIDLVRAFRPGPCGEKLSCKHHVEHRQLGRRMILPLCSSVRVVIHGLGLDSVIQNEFTSLDPYHLNRVQGEFVRWHHAGTHHQEHTLRKGELSGQPVAHFLERSLELRGAGSPSNTVWPPR